MSQCLHQSGLYSTVSQYYPIKVDSIIPDQGVELTLLRGMDKRAVDLKSKENAVRT